MKQAASAILLAAFLSSALPAAAHRATPTLAQQIVIMQKTLAQMQKRLERMQGGRRAAAHRRPVRAVAAKYTVHLPAERVGMSSYLPVTAPPASAAPIAIGTPGPQQASVRSAYQQQNALFQRGWTVTPAITYSYGDTRFFTLNGFMALGAIFLGNINVARQQNTVFTPSVNFTYGANSRIQYDVTVPTVVRTSIYTSAGAQSASNQQSDKDVSNTGIGDVNAGLYYALPPKSLGAPSVILNAHVTVPTGTGPYGVKVIQQKNGNDNLSYTSTLPTGGGVWGLSFGGTVIAQADPAILFAGVDFYHNFISRFHDISPAAQTVVPGYVHAGDALSLNLGTAFALNDKMSTSFSIQDTLVRATRVKPVKGQWSTIAGSSLNSALFNIGTTFATTPRNSYQVMLGIGITHDAPNFQFTIRAPHS